MLAEIVFVTRFLAVVAGAQPVTLEGDPSIRSVELRSDDVKFATLTSPPWSVRIDFGKEIAPHELTAIAYDEEGREIGRDTQTINLPRPLAEIALLLKRDGDALTVQVKSTHLTGQAALSFAASLDGKVLQKSRSIIPSFRLPPVDTRTIHSLGVEIEFADHTKARKEIVFGGIYSEQVPAELTPIAVRAREQATGSIPACLALDGTPVLPTAIEDGRAKAYFVLVGSRGVGRQRLGGGMASDVPYQVPRTDLVAVSSAARTVKTSTELKTDLFDSADIPQGVGTRRLVTRMQQAPGLLRMTDAVAAAGLRALGEGKRRAVVLVIGGIVPRDHSTHTPQEVRRYLARIGVPLLVWSLDGPRPELEAAWGPVKDVSRMNFFFAATEELEKELTSQRIAWMPVTPLNAIRVRGSTDCVYTPLAKDQ
jgi:hypothetical protein